MQDFNATPIVAVCCGGINNPKAEVLAAAVGHQLAANGAIVVTGGLGGVMESACRGAKEAGGMTIGILPGKDPRDANPWVDIAIPTGLGEARNALVVNTSRVVIAVGGEYGTLSEIALALKTGKPVVGLSTWHISIDDVERESIYRAESPADAVEEALRMCRQQPC